MTRSAYITSTGAFLPGEPVPNERMEQYLGAISERRSRLGRLVLRQNGIQTRHYARTPDGTYLHTNAQMAALASGPLNVVDLQTAIELYTPLYALFLSDQDFWRASNSLQLDDIIAIYIDRILNTQLHVALVHNRHPMVPRSTLEAGFRLTLHGLDAKALHGSLRAAKARAGQSSGSPEQL